MKKLSILEQFISDVVRKTLSEAGGYGSSDDLEEKAPPGWEKTVKAMKKDKSISNPWALAWSMKNKGFKPHYKDQETSLKGTPHKKKGMSEHLGTPGEVTRKDVLRILVHVLRNNPDQLRKSPDEIADEFVENVPEITDSEVSPRDLVALAAMARKFVIGRQQQGG